MIKVIQLSTVVVLVAASAFGGSAAVATAATSQSPHDPNSPILTQFANHVGATFIKNQGLLDQLNTWIQSQPGWQSAGYINEINDAHNLSTTLLWSGDSPLQTRALRKAASLGISASIQQRPLKLPQIVAAENKLLANKAVFAAAGFDLTSVTGVQSSTSEIQLNGIMTANPAAGTEAADDAATASSISSLAASMAGSAVTLNANSVVQSAVGKATSPAAVPQTIHPDTGTLPTRQSDTVPHSAGAYMENDEGETCSTGFSLIINDEAYTTTARHCVSDSSGWEPRSGDGDSFGTTSGTSTAGALSVLSTEGQPWAYDGDWDNAIGYAKTVVGSYDVGINDLVCTGGGNSGEHCGVEVNAFSVMFNDGTGNGNVSTISAYQIDPGAIAVIQGDSGGPVVSLNGLSGDAYDVKAVGMIQGFYGTGMTGSSCGNVADAGTNECSTNVLFTSIDTVISSGGLSASLDTY
jgi:hypothetical protein